jgi:hypothetical protein
MDRLRWKAVVRGVYAFLWWSWLIAGSRIGERLSTLPARQRAPGAALTGEVGLRTPWLGS